MLKFNNANIVTGYIKQLLADFNLPRYRIYTKAHEAYYNEHGEESPEIINSFKKTIANINLDIDAAQGTQTSLTDHIQYVNYIKNNYVQRYVEGRWETTNIHYHYGKKILNSTKNLIVKNNVYDSYTHEYLGNYLRFQRDYNNLDLMSMYNCFSNTICPNVNITVNGSVFKSSDNRYKIYMVPVKLFKQYTIAIDCNATIEMFCGLYHKYLDQREKVLPIVSQTYCKYNNLKFNAPILYTALTCESLLKGEDFDYIKSEIAQQESNLKLFIKLPFDNNSSITILEGDYLGYNDSLTTVDDANQDSDDHIISSLNRQQNRTIINLFDLNRDPEAFNDLEFKPISELQLLKYNTQESYPFADRLIEYLVGNAITHLDDIGDNTLRVQKVMHKNGITYDVDGLWEDKIRIVLYEAMMNENIPNGTTLYSNDKMDCLGYVDKDVEQYYSYPEKYYVDKINSDGTKERIEKIYYVSIGKYNLYENIYKAQAAQIKKQREGKK